MLAVLKGSVTLGKPLLFAAAAKGSLWVALAAICALAFARASAAVKHLIWVIGLAGLLLLPLLSTVLPPLRMLPDWTGDLQAGAGTVGANAESRSPTAENKSLTAEIKSLTAEIKSLTARAPTAIDSPRPAPKAELSALHFSRNLASAREIGGTPRESARLLVWTDWLLWLWGGGAALLALRLIFARSILSGAARHCVRLDSEAGPGAAELATAFHGACAQLGLRRRITLLLDPRRTIPLVWGIFHVRLLLPAEALEWNEAQVRCTLLHELAHVRRRDPLTQWLAQIACALHWWNPLVWLAAWRLYVERERACDDLVLAGGVAPSTYAEHLLNVATNLTSAAWTHACGLAMARPSSLEGRVRAILSPEVNRREVTHAAAGAALLLGVTLAIPLAILHAAEENEPPAVISPQIAPPPISPAGVVVVSTKANSAEVSTTGNLNALALVSGEGADARVLVHEFGQGKGPIVFSVSADDREGKWWDVARLSRDGEGEAQFPELPADWLPRGRIVFLPALALGAEGTLKFAEIDSATGRIPLAVRPASGREIADALIRNIPSTLPQVEIDLDGRVFALAANAPAKAIILPAMAAEDLTGPPRGALCFPYVTMSPGRPAKCDRMLGQAETVNATATLLGRGVQVDGTLILRYLDEKFASAAEASHQTDAAILQEDPRVRHPKQLRTEFSARLGWNDTLVVPIASEGLFPETLVATFHPSLKQRPREHWQPPSARSPIQFDGWVLTWPLTDQKWFTENFNYQGAPDKIAGVLADRRNTSMKGRTGEDINVLKPEEAAKLLDAFRHHAGATVTPVAPFTAKQHEPDFDDIKYATHFTAAGAKGSVFPYTDGRYISTDLQWDAPVLLHMSASSGYALISGDSLCVLLPGPADPEKFEMLVLRCVDPDAR